MNYFTVFIVSVALGIDAFSVAVGIGLGGAKKKQMLKITAAVTVFHVFMPLAGLYLGSILGRIAGPLAGVIGALVLMAIGLSVIWKSLKELGFIKVSSASAAGAPQVKEQSILASDTFLSLLLLGGSVSLDALSVGFGLGALQVDLWLTVITMGIIAGAMTLTGLLCGRLLSRTFGKWAEVIGGVILLGVGLKLLFL